LGSVGKSITTN